MLTADAELVENKPVGFREVGDEHAFFKRWHEWIKSYTFLCIMILFLAFYRVGHLRLLSEASDQANLEINALVVQSLGLRFDKLDSRIVFELDRDDSTEGLAVTIVVGILIRELNVIPARN